MTETILIYKGFEPCLIKQNLIMKSLLPVKLILLAVRFNMQFIAKRFLHPFPGLY
jgi:hypothetical protein